MNSRQLQYAVLLSEVLNVSQAAEKLNITQPALSKQILSLEKELGVMLFDRSETPLKLTPAGENFIRDAKELLFKEEELRRSMEEFKTGEKGRLTIGISPFKASYFLSDVIKKLREEFPGLQIVLSEKNSSQLQKDTAEGIVDFSILNLPVDDSVLDVIPLSDEPVVLVVPKCFAASLSCKNGKNTYPEISLSECKDIPFIALSKTQELRRLFDKLSMAEGVSLNINTEVVGVTTAFSLARAGIGATILPLKFIEGVGFDDCLCVFRLKNAATVRRPAVVKQKGRYVSKYAQKAIEIIYQI